MAQTILSDTFWREQEFSIASNIFYAKEYFMPHTHTYYEFFLVLEGELIHTLKRTNFRFAEESTVFSLS